MDGGNVAADFGNRFAAEIRLPEALEEKLLCPFHYFGVADPVPHGEQFWRSGKYDATELENVYVPDHARAISGWTRHRSAYPLRARPGRGQGDRLLRHHRARPVHGRAIQPEGYTIGCLCLRRRRRALPGTAGGPEAGQLTFLFTVDVLSEGLDVPE